jgi:hypothetical protein
MCLIYIKFKSLKANPTNLKYKWINIKTIRNSIVNMFDDVGIMMISRISRSLIRLSGFAAVLIRRLLIGFLRPSCIRIG